MYWNSGSIIRNDSVILHAILFENTLMSFQNKEGPRFAQECFYSSWQRNTWNQRLHRDWPRTNAVQQKRSGLTKGLLLLLLFENFPGRGIKRTCRRPWFVLKQVRVQTSLVPEEGVVFHATFPKVFARCFVGGFEEEWCLVALQKKNKKQKTT